MAELCSLEQVKQWLGIESDDDSEDDSLQRLIVSTSSALMREMRRPDLAGTADYTDRLVGNCTSEIYLKHYPINSISTVTVNGVDQDESADGIASGWFFDADEPILENRQKVILVGAFWPRSCTGVPNIVISYNAGYDENSNLPSDISQAVIEWIAWLRGYSQLQGADQTTTSWQQIGQYQQASTPGKATLDASGLTMPESVRQVVERYARTSL